MDFHLDADDPFVAGEGDAEHAYLDGAREAWVKEELYMDWLHQRSPVRQLKLRERDLYLHHWDPWLHDGARVLDVGCGIGRFALPLLDRGATVHGVDADLASLRRLAWRAVGRPGSLDLHWSGVHVLPEVEVDLVVACEVLCYAPDLERALAGAVARLRPGGVLLLALEGRWGWACAPDVPAGALGQALVGDGELDLPGDRYVRTLEGPEVEALVADAGLELELLTPTHYVLDGPLEAVAGDVPPLDVLLDVEEACRVHPVWAPLNRIWTVAARRP
ncbi:MAG: methyltransferase domain-containing protein [Alphaproteobacteria bacterium]|nr:methyltransferase domain-containing protein [Alphaproteobacteria bacterium]